MPIGPQGGGSGTWHENAEAILLAHLHGPSMALRPRRKKALDILHTITPTHTHPRHLSVRTCRNPASIFAFHACVALSWKGYITRIYQGGGGVIGSEVAAVSAGRTFMVCFQVKSADICPNFFFHAWRPQPPGQFTPHPSQAGISKVTYIAITATENARSSWSRTCMSSHILSPIAIIATSTPLFPSPPSSLHWIVANDAVQRASACHTGTRITAKVSLGGIIMGIAPLSHPRKLADRREIPRYSASGVQVPSDVASERCQDHKCELRTPQGYSRSAGAHTRASREARLGLILGDANTVVIPVCLPAYLCTR